MFEFLFRYPRQSFQQSDWFFASGWSWQWLVAAIVLAAIVTAVSLRAKPIGLGKRFVLLVLQVLVIGGLLTLLWKPSLKADKVQAGENAVTVLIDTSRSMHHADAEMTRLEQVSGALQQNRTLQRLESVFDTETLAVADSQTSFTELATVPAGNRSRLGHALTNVLDSAAERPLAGVVLISDGAETDSRTQEWWQSLLAYQVPVYTVAAATGLPENDLALTDVELAPAVTSGSEVSARLAIRYTQPGAARLRILDGDRLLVATTINLPVDQSRYTGRVEFNAGEPGLRDLRFELVPLSNEKNTSNNSQRRVLDVEQNKRRILYVEGEPRWEYKFMRRAVHDSPTVELVGLLHTSPNKFYRQGVRDADELKDGFPTDRETLFSYDAVIIGSLDAAMLNADQQENLREFVRVRGGSL
ncbi:MAG: VWA domain-containing protein, partial [Gammaproteobacteria bacterium]|nr:VWA domain-containing protein [Gammaproteobacteria bacterium]